MYQPKLATFDAAQPLLPGISPITIAEALTCEQLLVTLDAAPSAEARGQTLLVSTDFRRVKNAHLDGSRVRFLDQPVGEDAMLGRIKWMWHAGSRSPDPDMASWADDAVDAMVSQVSPEADFYPEKLAKSLSRVQRTHPDIVAALFTGDLDDVPDKIDAAVADGGDEQTLVGAAAWMFVTWGALEQQLEACHGHRLIHYPLDGLWGANGSESWTIGQLFRPQAERHKFAHEMMNLYHTNLSAGVKKVDNKTTLNRIERTLSRMDLGGFNRVNEREILALFGHGRMASIPVRLDAAVGYADAFQRQYELILAGPDGGGRAGQRADMLNAHISAVHRTAIVCARTHHLSSAAANAASANDLRAMLDAGFPDVLKAANDRRVDYNKFLLRQLFHVVRVEFLRDGEHIPKSFKSAKRAEKSATKFELSEKGRRRGHEIFDLCRVALKDQPADWRFITPFGWQCDGAPRIRLSAPPCAGTSAAGCSPDALDQFKIERDHAAAKQRAEEDKVPFAGLVPAAAPTKKFGRTT